MCDCCLNCKNEQDEVILYKVNGTKVKARNVKEAADGYYYLRGSLVGTVILVIADGREHKFEVIFNAVTKEKELEFIGVVTNYDIE